MNYSFAKDELFLLCVISGSEQVVGLTDPFLALTDEEMGKAVKLVAGSLESRNIVYRDENGNMMISDEYEALVKTITEFSMSYILVNETGEDDFVFVKRNKAVHMYFTKEHKVVLESFENTEYVKGFFKQRYNDIIVPTDSLQYMLSFSSELVDKAIEQVKAGNMEQALKIMDCDELERDEMIGMLDAVVYPTSSETIISKSSLDVQEDETVMKICNTPNCSWIIKISTVDKCRNTMIFKATAEDITEMLFEF